ncbi:hypothetical protein N2152v2_011127 [Parachlorella kessleri]
MPPSKKKPSKASEAPTTAAPFGGLPPDVLGHVGRAFAKQDKLNNVWSYARDIANLAMTSKKLNKLAQDTLWRLLGEQYSQEGGSGSALGSVAKSEWYETVHLESKVRKLDKLPSIKVLAKDYAAVPDHVPAHIYHEFRRLGCLGTAGSNAKKEFKLTDGDLKNIPHVEKSRGAMGTAHVYRLGDLLAAARAKHGSAGGMQAEDRARAQRGQKRKQAAKDAVEQRRKALAEALKPLGAEVSKTMLEVGLVARYLKGGKDAPKLEPMLPYLGSQAHYLPCGEASARIRSNVVGSGGSRWLSFKMHFREETEEGGYGRGNYFAAADKAAAELCQQEEEDCIRMGIQGWAAPYGGGDTALAQPVVPREGALREAIRAAMHQKVLTSVREDGGDSHMWADEDYYEETDDDEAARLSLSFFDGAEDFFQVEASASSKKDLAALEDRVGSQLHKLVGRAENPADPADQLGYVQELKRAFRVPAGEGAAAGEAAGEAAAKAGGIDASGEAGAVSHKSLFFVRFRRMQIPRSFLDGRSHGNRASCVELNGKGPEEVLEDAVKKWSDLKPGMEVRTVQITAGQVPQWVREAAAPAPAVKARRAV